MYQFITHFQVCRFRAIVICTVTVLTIRSIDIKRQMKMNHEECNDVFLVTRNPVYLPTECIVSVMYHSDSIYVGSRIRVWKRSPDNNSEVTKLGTVHWYTSDKGIYISFDDSKQSGFVQLKQSDRWVVRHSRVMAGALLCHRRSNSNDIARQFSQMSQKEMKTVYSMRMINSIYFKFPTKQMQSTYPCLMYKRRCFCREKIRPKLNVCSPTNIKNSGRYYYACKHLNTGYSHCDFFAWKEQFDHGLNEPCECGKLCKKIELNKYSGNYALICFEKESGGCQFFQKLN